MSFKKLNLLNTAKGYVLASRTAKVYHPEETDLALAWLNGEISPKQAGFALKEAGICRDSAPVYRLATALRNAIQTGKLEFKELK